MDALESEIALALTAREITSAELAQLIERVTAAAVAADEEAAKESKRALDPAVLVDTQAAYAAVVNAEFKRDRLSAALPRLQHWCAKVEAGERYSRWVIDYDNVRAQRDAVAAELRGLYAPLVVKLVDLLERIEAVDAEVKRVNAVKPNDADQANGDGRYLDLVERTARGAGRLNESMIARDLKLPHWDPADGYAWPVFRLALPFRLSELEERQIRQSREEVRQRARDILRRSSASRLPPKLVSTVPYWRCSPTHCTGAYVTMIGGLVSTPNDLKLSLIY
jgi:hypothetical protein